MSFTDRVLWGTPFIAPAVFLFIQLMQGKAKSVLGSIIFELGFMVVLLGGIPLFVLFHKLNPAEIIKRRMRKGGLLPTDQDLYSRLQEINSELMAWTQADGKARVEHWNREARLIGEILNRQGGKARMLQVHQMLGLGRPIESAWDGIGQWRG